MRFQSENGKKSHYELEVYLENVNKSLFENWKKFQLENGRKNAFKNQKESPITKWK